MSCLTEYLKEHRKEAYDFATNNTSYNADGRPVISKEDEWAAETEWDDLFRELSAESKTCKGDN